MFRRQRIRACSGQWLWGGRVPACDILGGRSVVSCAMPSLWVLQGLLQESEAFGGSFSPSALNS